MLAKEGIVLFTVSSILASFISLGMFVVVSKEDGTDTQCNTQCKPGKWPESTWEVLNL